MKILDLVLMYCWYDMINAGIKSEEYRKKSPYWNKRLTTKYDAVRFHRGYTSTTMMFLIDSINSGKGNTVWGAPENESVYIIKLGKRL